MLAAALCTCAVAPANAFVGKFSRACRFDTLPGPLKPTFAAFFVEAGAPAHLANLASRPGVEQAEYWINESLTTDYFQVRYYLFAKSNIYQRTAANPSKYILKQTFRSNWSFDQVMTQIRTNPKFSPHYTNRGPVPLYNARAGDPRILIQWQNSVSPVTAYNIIPGDILVVGRHLYYDPTNGVQVDLGESRATRCNETNFGLGLFDW